MPRSTEHNADPENPDSLTTLAQETLETDLDGSGTQAPRPTSPDATQSCEVVDARRIAIYLLIFAMIVSTVQFNPTPQNTGSGQIRASASGKNNYNVHITI